MNSSALPKRLMALLAVLLLVVAACGGDSDTPETTDADTTTTVADAETPDDTDAPDETTAPDDAATTTTGADGGDDDTPVDSAAVARARERAEAAQAVLPSDYTSEIVDGEPDDGPTDEDNIIFAACLDDGEFDIDELSGITAGMATLTADAPLQATGMPGPSASVEVRVFESADAGDNAFAVLERIFGTQDGRDCLVETVTDSMGGMMEGAEIDFAIDELDVDGADVGNRITMSLSMEGFEAEVSIDLLVAHDGDLASFASFFAFGDDFPADLQTEIMQALR